MAPLFQRWARQVVWAIGPKSSGPFPYLLAEEAIERAEVEALEYAGTVEESPDSYLGIAQSYRLVDAPADGAEVFSLMRSSALEPDEYLDAFFDTGTERQKTVE